ncbi:F0F1 ATP synthase subunit B [Candidatus Kaiserbacteria bacterium]|nr:F0F1 ATP synthase subunit B [Candidatus Kaiserbacteria bacterium]
MQEIFNAFGIDARLIVIQIINFGLLLFALWYFLYTPVLTLLDERQKKIEKGVTDAEDAARSKEAAASERTTIVSEAHKDAEHIVERAKQHADEKVAALIQDAQHTASRITADAQARGEEIKARAEEESKDEVAKLAILAAEKVLREKLD